MFTNGLKVFYEANAGGGAGQATSNASQQTTSEPMTYDAWLSTQDETVKGLLDGHAKGLKSALETEREIRKSLEKQMRDLAAKAEKGSEFEKQLTSSANQLAEADRKAEFYDAAHKAGVTNLKLAYLTAVSDELFDKKGNADFKAMKETYPELFGTKSTPRGNAGEGTDNPVTTKTDVNATIRRMAGRT